MATIGTRLGFTNIAAGTNPRSVNISLVSGTGRKLVVVAANETTGAATIDSATFDGTSITSFSSRTAASIRERWFYYDIPDGKGAGTYAIAVTLSSDTGALSVAAWITDGDTAGEPQISVTTVAGGAASGSANIDAESGDALFTAYFDPTSGNTASAASSQVTLGNSNNISTSGFRAHKYDALGDATETVTVTWTPSTTTGDKTFSVVNSTPVAAGPTVTVQPTAQTARINGDPTNTATFSCTATGTGTVDLTAEIESGVGSGSFGTLANGSGATWTGLTGTGSGSASVTAVGTFTAKTLSGRKVRLKADDDNGTTYSNEVVLTVLDGPVLSASTATTNGSGVASVTATTDDVLSENGELYLVTATVRGQVIARTTFRGT